MERLTEKHAKKNGGYYMKCSEYCEREETMCLECERTDEIVDRLGAIENILGDEYDLDRLRELAQADREGRCVVLPCKVGDTLYRIQRFKRGKNWRKEAEFIRTVELNSLYKTDNRKYGYNVSPGGNYAADETKEKMAAARTRMAGKRHPCNKAILKIDRETGEILERYPSAEMAAKDIGIWGPSVSKCARTGEGCVGGFLWCYEKDWTETFFDKFKGKTWVKQGNGWCDAEKLNKPWAHKKHGKAVLCVETGEEYISAREASRQTGVRDSCICRCCNEMAHTAGGYHWEYI